MKLTSTRGGQKITVEIPSKEEWEQFEEYSTEWWLHLKRYNLHRYLVEQRKLDKGAMYRS